VGLDVKAPDNQGKAAGFWQREFLQIASGAFCGFVDFSASGIRKIARLKITRPRDRIPADFSNCKSSKL
jgi:hypothetical protein